MTDSPTDFQSDAQRKRLHPAAILLFICTPLYYLIPWTRTGAAAELAGLPFLLTYIVVLPGYVLVRLLPVRPRDAFDRAVTAFQLGLGAFVLVAFLWALSGPPNWALENTSTIRTAKSPAAIMLCVWCGRPFIKRDSTSGMNNFLVPASLYWSHNGL